MHVNIVCGGSLSVWVDAERATGKAVEKVARFLQASWRESPKTASWPAGWKAAVLLKTALLRWQGWRGDSCLPNMAQLQREVTVTHFNRVLGHLLVSLYEKSV